MLGSRGPAYDRNAAMAAYNEDEHGSGPSHEAFRPIAEKIHDVTVKRLDDLKEALTGLRNELIGFPVNVPPIETSNAKGDKQLSGLIHTILDRQHYINGRIDELLYIVSKIRREL